MTEKVSEGANLRGADLGDQWAIQGPMRSDVFAPPLSLLCKIGSIVVHVEEGAGEDGHAYDWAAIRSLLADREVQGWIEGMRKGALVPVKRR